MKKITPKQQIDCVRCEKSFEQTKDMTDLFVRCPHCNNLTKNKPLVTVFTAPFISVSGENSSTGRSFGEFSKLSDLSEEDKIKLKSYWSELWGKEFASQLFSIK